MLVACRVPDGLDTVDASKPASLVYDPTILWERAMSFARSMESIHSWAELFDGSPVVVEVLASSKV
jgi:hypothetical protein